MLSKTRAMRALWDGLGTARRRAVLKSLVFSVEVRPVGKGKRVKAVEAIGLTVTINWRRAQRRVAFDEDRILTSLVDRVSPNAEETATAAVNR